jgi:YD repeat-containing protein
MVRVECIATGRATTNGNMTTTYDASVKVMSSETTTGNTTTVYDASGRNVGRSRRTAKA